MIRILVVDDNKLRVDNIRTLIDNLQDCRRNIEYVSTVFAAKKLLLTTQFDVMLLDLVLPIREDSEPQANGGIDLLHEMTQLSQYKLPSHVFVISEFENALMSLSSISNKLSFTSIKYDATSNEWRVRLENYLNQIIRTGIADNQEYDYDVAILCALEKPELFEIKRLPYQWEPYGTVGDTTDYFVGTFNGKRIICAAAYEMGMSASAILATKIIAKFKPRYLIMTGIAGAVNGKGLNYGDVLVADPSFDYESGKKVFENGQSVFKPDYKQIRLDDMANQIMRRLSGQSGVLHAIYDECGYEKPNNTLQIKIGALGSGAAVLSDPQIIDRVLQHQRKFIGFDMEAYAVMLSGSLSSAPKPTTVVMKSVSDFGEGKTDKYQKYAAYTSARVLDLFLKELYK